MPYRFCGINAKLCRLLTGVTLRAELASRIAQLDMAILAILSVLDKHSDLKPGSVQEWKLKHPHFCSCPECTSRQTTADKD